MKMESGRIGWSKCVLSGPQGDDAIVGLEVLAFWTHWGR